MNEHESELSREELLARYGKQPVGVSADTNQRSPFKFLDAYEVGDSDIFFGRDAEIEELLRHYHGFGHVLIYGESGSGKSSLVQCGLRSQIPDADALFIPLRIHATGLATLSHQICESVAQQVGEPVDLDHDAGFADALRGAREIASRPLVLFFDQFEELFIFHDVGVRRQFANQLAAVHGSHLNIKVIIGIRQDYLAFLSELEETVDGLFDNRFWLRRMSRENAAQAIVKACATRDVKISPDLAESIIHRLDPTGQGVELPYVQVVMDRLYRQAVEDNPGGPLITSEDVANLGDIAHILASFLAEEVAKLPSPDAGRQMLKAFVSSEGTRRTLDFDSVVYEASSFGEAIAPDVVQTDLDQLVKVRILRELADTQSYELRHDSLAATVAGWISEVEKELIEVRDNLVNRFKEYEARANNEDALLDQGFMDYLGVYKQRLAPLMNQELTNYVETSRQRLLRAKRRQQFAVFGAVLACVLVIVSGLASYAYVQAAARQKAELAEGKARSAEELAREARNQAERLLVESYYQKGADEVQKRQFARAVSWFYAAFDKNSAETGEGARSSERRLIGSWLQFLGKPLLHDGRVFAVAVSPDGNSILTGSEDGKAQLWDIASGMPRGNPLLHQDSVRCVAFNQDGTTILTGCENGMALLWNTESGEQVGKPMAHQEPVRAVAFSPDGKTVATGSEDLTAQLWNTETCQPRGEALEHQDSVWAVAFSPDGNSLLTGCEDGNAQLWDTRNGEPRGDPLPHAESVNAVAFSRDSSLIATASNDGFTRLWDAKKQQVLFEMLHTDEVNAVAFSVDGKSVLSGSWDATARLWDTETGNQIGELQHEEVVWAVAFGVDGQTVVTSSSDRTARLWDLDTIQRGTVLQHEDTVEALAFSPDGKIVATGCSDGTVQLWNVEDGKPIGVPLVHEEWIVSVAFSPAGDTVLTGCEDGSAQLWNVKTGKPRVKPLVHDGIVNAVAFAPDGKTVLTASDDGTAQLWDVSTGKRHGPPLEHADSVLCVAYAPDGLSVVTGSEDRTAAIWDTTAGEMRGIPMNHKHRVIAVSFSPDGKSILTGSHDQTARLWAADSQKLRAKLGHKDWVLDAAYSPDGKTVLTGSQDSWARLWNAETGVLLRELRHNGSVASVAYAPDGRTLLTGSDDGTAWLWDAASGAPRDELRHMEGFDLTVAFSPDGSRVLTGCDDASARLWLVPPPAVETPARLKLLVQLRTTLGMWDGTLRQFSQQEWLALLNEFNKPALGYTPAE